MADTHSKSRISLENRFEAGDIPEERHFTELIHSCFNQLDDGIKKEQGSPLKIQGPVNQNGIVKEVIQLFTAFPDQPGGGDSEWRIGLASVADSIPKEGLTFSDGEQVGNIRLFIQEDGNIGIGKTNPAKKLDVAGTMRAINLEGFINPDNGEKTGIEFPSITVDASKKGASIRYFSRGTSASLKIEAQEFTNDHIVLFPSGNVGIGTNTPEQKLHVKGKAKIEENLTVGAGTSSFAGLLQVNGNGTSSFADLLQVNGTGTSSFADLLHVKGTGSSKFDGSLNIGKELTVGAGASSIAGELTVTGSSVFKGNLEIEQGLTVGAGDSSIAGKLTVTGSSVFKNNLKIEEGLTVSGTCSFEGGFEAKGNATSSFGGDLNVTGQGASTFDGHLEVKGNGNSSFDESLEIGKQLIVNGLGDSNFKGKLKVTGSSVFEDNLEIKKGLTVGAGVSTFIGDLNIKGTGTTSIENTLKVKGTTTFTKALGVGKDAVTKGVQLDVDGKVQATSMKCTGDINAATLTSGKTEISDGSIKIDGIEINKKHLEKLVQLVSGTLKVKIKSDKKDYVLVNYKGREGDGDANRSIQFIPNGGMHDLSIDIMKLEVV